MIVIPTYNEKANITPLLRQIRKFVPEEPVLFVDDNSPDGTADAIRLEQAKDSQVLLKVRSGKLGLGSAYREVFQEVAHRGETDYIITMDADLSHPAERLPEMIAALRDCSAAVGSRYVAGGKIENWGLHRRVISRLANLYAKFAGGVAVADLTSGFVAYRTDLLQKLDLAHVRSDGYAFLVEMKYMIHQSRQVMKEVPITFTERREGKSKLSWKVAWEAVKLTTKVLLTRWV